MTDQRRHEVGEAIALARAGDRGAAYRLLRGVTTEDPFNAEAWLWLGGVTSDPVEQRAALERVIALDPGNTRAQRGLQALRTRNPGVFVQPQAEELAPAAAIPAPVPADSSMPAIGETTASAPVSPGLSQTVVEPVSAAGPRTIAEPAAPQTASQAATSSTQPIQAAVTEAAVAAGPTTTENMEAVAATAGTDASDGAHSSLEEELRCPYCGASTALEDVRCSHCQGELIVASDHTSGARLARLLLALLWLLAAAAAVASSVWTLGETQRIQAGTDHTLGPSLQQLGLAARTDSVLPVVSSIGLSLGGLALIGLIVAAGLLLRSRAMYVINLILVLAALAASIVLLVASLPILTGTRQLGPDVATVGLAIVVACIVVAGVELVLTLASRREFFPRRVRARIPVQSLSGAEHFRLGTRYRDRGWRWAAARELERAADQEPQVLKYRRALAEVYASMGDHLRARDELRASLNLQPDLSPAARAGALAEEVQHGRK